jgi:hypothetical protein
LHLRAGVYEGYAYLNLYPKSDLNLK